MDMVDLGVPHAFLAQVSSLNLTILLWETDQFESDVDDICANSG